MKKKAETCNGCVRDQIHQDNNSRTGKKMTEKKNHRKGGGRIK